jgi:hypothetical protein
MLIERKHDVKLIGNLIADRKFDLQTVYQRKSSNQRIGGLLEVNWHVAAGKIRVDLTACAQVLRADPRRG